MKFLVGSYTRGSVYKYWLLMREIVQNNSPRWLETVGLRESNPRFPYKSTVNIILMNSSVHMLKQSKNS